MINPSIATMVDLYPQIPFQKLLGIQVMEVCEDSAVIRLPFRQELAGGGNAFHGGALSSLLDLTGALAAWSGHDPDKGIKAATVSLTTNYLSAAQGTDIVARARVVKRGKELMFCEVNITEEATGKAIANGTMIYRIV